MKQSVKKRIKKLLRPVANFCRKITYKLMRNVINRLENRIKSSCSSGRSPLIPYCKDELIRVMFLFQAASFWPSWESFYNACMSDSRIRVEFAFLNELYGDTTQMLTAKQFLEEKGIPYRVYSDNFFSKFSPHILVMQTPYDYGHRKPHVRSAAFKRRGTRIVYIPYGIELSNTEHAQDAHFYNGVVRNAWRVFTFSERMREDYRMFCPNYAAVKCLGHPKFDALYHREQFRLSEEITEKSRGRKILVWHVHFPKLVPQPDESEVMATPKLEIYIKFARYITQKNDVFVILLPHPKFLDGEGILRLQAKMVVDAIADAENGYVDWADDYRPTMLNCNYFITDRSALMVEVSSTGAPVLYMSNSNYSEPLTPAIQPIIDSYEQGTDFDDMKEFVERCMRGEDLSRTRREQAFRENIPYFDGKSGERIKDHIVNALMDENRDVVQEELEQLRESMQQMERKLDLLLQIQRKEK